MTGVYGNFLTVFPELFDTISFRDGRRFRGIVVDTRNANIFRQKIGNKNTNTLDLDNLSYMYMNTDTARKLQEGDRFVHPEYGYEMSIVGRVPHNKAAGYTIFRIERVSGADSTQTERLDVKEPLFR